VLSNYFRKWYLTGLEKGLAAVKKDYSIVSQGYLGWVLSSQGSAETSETRWYQQELHQFNKKLTKVNE